MNSWHSYCSIYNLGHRYIADLLTRTVYVEEKIDGSQFSFAKDENGQLHIRTKGAVTYIDAPEKMFSKAAETVKEIADLLVPGWTYRAEYLAKPKHNSLAYNRVPKKHLIIFDVNTAEADYMAYPDKLKEAARLGLEVVPLLFQGMLTDPTMLRELLDWESVLGGQRIEGVVIKQCDVTLFGQDKKALMGKFVSEGFKEIHQGEWKQSNPSSQGIIVQIANELKTPARWNKAVQHLREAGQIEDSPRDIGKLMKEVPADIKKEFEEEIKDKLFQYAWPKIARLTASGLPEWYKDQLLNKQFEGVA